MKQNEAHAQTWTENYYYTTPDFFEACTTKSVMCATFRCLGRSSYLLRLSRKKHKIATLPLPTRSSQHTLRR